MSSICLPALYPPRETDASLAQRLQTRDAEAVSAIYDRYGKAVYAAILRIVGDATVAEDLVQETFIRLWNRSGSFDAARGALLTWVLAVARNLAIDHLRSSERRAAERSVELDQSIPAGQPDPVSSLHRQHYLAKAFANLTPRQKNVIRLAYYEGLSHSEMANRLKQPLGTVKTWVREALRSMRTELAA